MQKKALIDYSEELLEYFEKNNIKIFDYSERKNLKRIGQGGYAVVYSVILEGKNYALKSLNNNLDFDHNQFRQFKHELKLLYTVNHHPNIVKFYGVSTVLQLATDGSLRDYLQNKQQDGIYKIPWTEIVQIAKDITLGLQHLHNNKIIHRDLHSKNVLINDGSALISDFGISKQLNSTTVSSSNSGGMPAYTEPLYYIHGSNAVRDQKSDIYSLGVLFWELTSGVPPFNGSSDWAIIINNILHNKREKTIENTPLHYANLYKCCWSTEPNLRPALDKILIELDELSAEPVEFIINNINNQQIPQSDSFSSCTDSVSTVNSSENQNIRSVEQR
ncbi:8591_t:CDS:2 [Cetraspora pellucida]|uniref:8591_t:CDS:1 n=1 Tax=Cetraspora pellucida TaxID=1433469 RepID=A0A9N9NTB3_9GLOM|nr:8591_t:CDS:2 [Cetraspora pellucida]